MTGLLLIAPIPTVASTVETGFAALRSVLLFPLFILLIGVGISAIVFQYPGHRWRVTTALILAGLYILQLGNFLHTYLFRYPVYASEAYNFSSRLVSRYVSLAQAQGKRVLVISNTPENNFRHYLFDTNAYTAATAETVKRTLRQKDFTVGSVSFQPCKIGMQLPEKTIVIANATEQCKVLDFTRPEQLRVIPQLADAAPMYAIKNDSVCQGYRLPPYPKELIFSDLHIEALDAKHLCETFILQPIE